jgi:hypothetical protein
LISVPFEQIELTSIIAGLSLRTMAHDTLPDAEEERISYAVKLRESGDLRMAPPPRWFLGASRSESKGFVVGDLEVEFPGQGEPQYDAEISFSGANSVVGRALVLLEAGTVVDQCTPAVHAVVVDAK